MDIIGKYKNIKTSIVIMEILSLYDEIGIPKNYVQRLVGNQYLHSLEKLKDCDGKLCEHMANILSTDYISDEEVRKYIHLLKVMAKRNQNIKINKQYCDKPNHEYYKEIHFYTGIREKDKVIINNKTKRSNSAVYGSRLLPFYVICKRFTCPEMQLMIYLTPKYVKEDWIAVRIIEYCNNSLKYLSAYTGNIEYEKKPLKPELLTEKNLNKMKEAIITYANSLFGNRLLSYWHWDDLYTKDSPKIEDGPIDRSKEELLDIYKRAGLNDKEIAVYLNNEEVITNIENLVENYELKENNKPILQKTKVANTIK